MNIQAISAPEGIRRARSENPTVRERDLAVQLGISEAELLAAHLDHGVTRIEPRLADLLPGLEAVGEVMALTRNESAVHEKVGVYTKPVIGSQHALVLGGDIDLRIFPKRWAYGFAVEKPTDDGHVRHSLQFFDRNGDAVHKIHLRPESDVEAYRGLVEELLMADQGAPIVLDDEAGSGSKPAPVPPGPEVAETLRQRWSGMTDVHQFFGILRDLNLSRRDAVRLIGEDYAWQLQPDAVTAMLYQSVRDEVPIMCFVGSEGCIQIHTGTIHTVKPMGPWINVLDPTFNLHLRTDHVREVWAVRKPVKEGHVTSIEAYDGDGGLIAQFFGERFEGQDERPDWRLMVERMPHASAENLA